jgi:PAS domain S-box-containing protein
MIFFKRGAAKRAQEQARIKILEQRLKAATLCLEKISAGDFEMKLDAAILNDLTDENKIFIETIHRTQNTLIEYSERDKERTWVAQGVSTFMELIGGDNHKKTDFYHKILSLLIKYTGANQGGIFTVNDQDEKDRYLELAACYAYGKKKFVEKRVDPGQGLLGQCFLEKETNIFTHLPHNFTTITSGLGESTPGFLILVPMKYNDEVLGVIELASFKKLETYKIEFIEKIAENIASVALNMRNAKKVEILLEESKKKAQLLQEKEETLRQNLEELVATQEEMQRNQNELNRQTHLLKFILDSIPFPIFVKDEAGRYALVNKAEAKLFNLEYTDLLGKDDSNFVTNAEEWQVIKESDERVLASDVPIELPLQNFTTTTGTSYIFKTTKIPFLNNVTGKKNILGVSIDLTEKLSLEKELFKEKRISSSNMLLNIAGRQRMLSQKIGFYAESLVRGRKQNAGLLRDAIELHEHSLQVMRYGGMPMGVSSESPLTPLDENLIPSLEKIETVWEIYKRAAENILYFSSLETHFNDVTQLNDLEKSICMIEANGELLLTLNNDLMVGCLALNQTQLAAVC